MTLHYPIVRLLSVLGVVLCTAYVPEFHTFATCLVFMHFILAAKYSTASIKRIAKSSRAAVLLVSLIILAFVLYFQLPEAIVLIFGIHHAFNESYVDREKSLTNTIARILFTFSIYTLLLYSDSRINAVPEPIVYLVLGVSLLYLLTVKRKLPFYLSFEAIAILTLVLIKSFGYEPYFMHLLYYHVLFWLFHPLMTFYTENKKRFLTFSAENVVVALVLLLTIYPAMIHSEIKNEFFYAQLTMWGFVHIISSIGLSSLNPEPINKLFGNPTR